MQVYFFVSRYLQKIRHAQGNCFRPGYVDFISLTVSELLAMNRTVHSTRGRSVNRTRSQAVARIADRTAKNSMGHVPKATPSFTGNFCAPACHSPYEAVYQI